MNDYKELIAKFRAKKNDGWQKDESYQEQIITVQDILDAADAIEQLVSDYEILAKMYAKVNEDLCVRTRECDAAVADLRQFAIYAPSKDGIPLACCWCERQRSDGRCQWFIDHRNDSFCNGVYFEWQGVQEDNDEID